ncbi:MAG TPA: flagellar basal body-associated FliL family protein [Spongiibacteraceae bacterium]|nr:flagellar basal body-associated FliL family protein [Spongiibacteraceae bacterium]
MAVDDNLDDETGEEGDELATQAKVDRRKLLIVVAIGALLMLLSIGATLYFLGVFDSDESPAGEAAAAGETAAAGKDKKTPALYFPLKPAFIVNFTARGRTRYLQAEVSVQTRDPAVIAGIQQHMPLIRNRVVLLYSGERYEELQTPEGRAALADKTREAIQEVLVSEGIVAPENAEQGGVEHVLFTSFVMQ